MLSPVSHRVCCLAVMAPALTKADRQADCLPVVLSESYCVPKVNDTFNGETRLNEIRLKCAYSSDYIQGKRRPFMHRACWRTPKNCPGFLCKYRAITNDSKSLLFNSRVRTPKYKTWPSTKLTTAYADKIKFKYTMNRSNSNIKNMGLSKANTSFGIQSFKMKRFSKENLNTNPNIVEDALNFSDSTDSTIRIESRVSDLTVLTSNLNVNPVIDDTKSCLNNGERTSEELCTISQTKDEISTKLLPCLTTSSKPVEAIDVHTSVILTDLITKASESSNISSSILHKTNVALNATCNTDSKIVNTKLCFESQPSKNNSDSSILSDSNDNLPLKVDSLCPPHFLGTESCSITKFSISNDSLFSVFNSSSSNSIMSRYPISYSKLCSTYRSHMELESQTKCPVIRDSIFGLRNLNVRKEKKPCCLPSNQELSSIESVLTEKLKSSDISTFFGTTMALLKPLSRHIKIQLSNLVDYYQRKYQIPCQRQIKHVNTKQKDLVDLKTELLQSEDVKNMSTAVLVNLVRKLETGSQSKLLPNISQDIDVELIESADKEFDFEDVEDMKYASGVFLKRLKCILRTADPDLTESSSDDEDEEESDSETEEDIPESTPVNKIALWKYLTERAKLGSRSTWLLARIHELDYRIKEYEERLSEIIKSEGQVSFEEPSSSSVLSTQESDNASLQTSIKSNVKSIHLPLNGFLDRNDASHIAKTAVNESFLPELADPKITESDMNTEGSCCRTQPLNISMFRKRKLLVISGLHTNPKFSRLSSVNCICNSQRDMSPCILCTGQYTSLQSIDPDSTAVRDRIAILDPYFHPALSTEKDIPLTLHMENILKCHPTFHFVPEISSNINIENEAQQIVRHKFSDLRSHRKLSRYARSLSAKYRKKHHARNVRHFRKHKLFFGKWRRYQKPTFRARNRFRRYSLASSGSSPDSPVHSPMSAFDDGFEKRRDSQFDIDDVIIPCNSRSGRPVEIQYKEIMTPSWHCVDSEEAILDDDELEDEENITDSYLIKRHDILEIEEKEKVKKAALGLNKRLRRNRCDSRADSSGANTPDPTSLYNQDIFQTPNFSAIGGPASPASPLTTPGSTVVSDDSQPASNSGFSQSEKKKLTNQKKTIEDNVNIRPPVDFDEVLPYEPLTFPLSDEVYNQLLAETDHDKEVLDIPNTQHFSPSPLSSSSSTSTVEEDEDITDPEWTVVKPIGSSDQPLVLKFAKR